MGISLYIVGVFSFLILLIPVSQSNAAPFNESDEINFKAYKEIQKLETEKFRDYYFKVIQLENPYQNEISEERIIFITKEFNMPIRIDRHDEEFQTHKNEQLNFAQKKFLEIMGGKSINNFLINEQENKIIPVLKFTDEELTNIKAINREDENFQSYKIQQNIFAEQTFNKMIEDGYWQKNPYDTDGFWQEYIKNRNNTKINNNENNIDTKLTDDKMPRRLTQEFQNLKIEQVLLAEKTRDNVLKLSVAHYPYVENDVKVEVNQNENSEIIPKVLTREHPTFIVLIEKQRELAQEKLNNIPNIKKFNEDEVKGIKLIDNTEKVTYYDRYDKEFEYMIKMEEETALNKIFEILGSKMISNFDEVKTEIILVPDKANQNNVNLDSNHELESIAFSDKIIPENNQNLDSSTHILPELNGIKNKPVRDPNVLCFGLGC